MWRRPIPAEQAALDRPWRVWASIAIGVFALVSVLLGFLVVPWSEDSDFDALAVICRAIGIPGYERSAASPDASASPASQVAWTSSTLNLMGNASIKRGATVVSGGLRRVPRRGRNGSWIRAFPTFSPAAATFKQLQDYKSATGKAARPRSWRLWRRSSTRSRWPTSPPTTPRVRRAIASRPTRRSVSRSSVYRHDGRVPRPPPCPCDACHARSGPLGATPGAARPVATLSRGTASLLRPGARRRPVRPHAHDRGAAHARGNARPRRLLWRQPGAPLGGEAWAMCT